MFGKHPLLERELRKSGKSAMAAVLTSEHELSHNAMKDHCTVTIRVEPEGEPAFEATAEAFLTIAPRVGGVVAVLYDPTDHSKLVIDDSDAALRAAFTEDLRRRSGQPSGDPQTTGGQGRLVIAVNGQVQGLGSPAAAAPPAADPLDRLSKLADLHDRGVLTDAEFETQKQQLLGE
jgi:putative oligomerization/nucleic acid binding protein